MTLRAIVFDFDGLILDTETPIYRSWQRVFDEFASSPLTIEEWSAEVGTIGGLDVVELLQSRARGALDIDAMQAARRAHRDVLLAAEAALPGVLDWLDDAQRLGLAIGVASSSERE